MEYKRNKQALRRRRKRAAARPRQKSVFAPKALFTLIVMGGIIYLVSASAVGTYIAENLIAPVFSTLKNNSASDEDSNALKISLSPDTSSVTSEVTLPGLTLYTLQMGVYASEENAVSQGDILKSQSAAGYVLDDTDKFRVLSAAYENRDDAKAVKDRLISEGLDCTLYTLSCDDAAFKICTDSASLDLVSNAFLSFRRHHGKLSSAILEFDKNTQSIAEAEKVCSEILASFKSDLQIISESSNIPQELSCMTKCYDEFCTQLSSLTSANYATQSDFSSAMKHAQLYMANSYINFSKNLSLSV